MHVRREPIGAAENASIRLCARTAAVAGGFEGESRVGAAIQNFQFGARRIDGGDLFLRDGVTGNARGAAARFGWQSAELPSVKRDLGRVETRELRKRGARDGDRLLGLYPLRAGSRQLGARARFSGSGA